MTVKIIHSASMAVSGVADKLQQFQDAVQIMTDYDQRLGGTGLMLTMDDRRFMTGVSGGRKLRGPGFTRPAHGTRGKHGRQRGRGKR